MGGCVCVCVFTIHPFKIMKITALHHSCGLNVYMATPLLVFKKKSQKWYFYQKKKWIYRSKTWHVDTT